MSRRRVPPGADPGFAAPGSPGRRASLEERRLWRALMRDVQPLAGESLPPPLPPEAAPPVPPPPAPGPVLPAAPPPPRLLAKVRPELVAGGTDNIDRATAERFRRGALAIEARLDLHGMTQDDAHAALRAFLGQSVAQGRRCVLVITGKGWRGDGDGDSRDGGPWGGGSWGGSGGSGRGVLRQRLPDWLNLGPNREHLLAFAPAQSRHGGGGAFYILLKRRRPKPDSW